MASAAPPLPLLYFVFTFDKVYHMPTVKPRLMITFEPQTYEAIRELARVQKMPMGRIVRELMTEATPTLIDMLEALRLVKESPKRALALMAESSGRAVTEMMQAGLELRRRPGRPRKR